MKKAIIAVAFMLLAQASFASEPKFDVRSVLWGMNKSEVASTESGKPKIYDMWDDKEILGYRENILGKEASIFYEVEHERGLSSVVFAFKIESGSERRAMLSEMQRALEGKYQKVEQEKREEGDVARYTSPRTNILLREDERETMYIIYRAIDAVLAKQKPPKSRQEELSQF